MNIALYKVELIKEKGVRYSIDNNRLQSPSQVATLMCDVCKIDKQCEEVLMIIGLDTKNKPLGLFEVSRGTVNSSMVHPREIFKRLMLLNASGFFAVHNHPSKEIMPSSEDINVTKRLKDCGNILGIQLLDHIIVGNYGEYYSFCSNNKI